MTKTGFEQVSVGELRQELVSKGICTQEEADSIKGKNNLVDKLTGNCGIDDENPFNFGDAEFEQEEAAQKREKGVSAKVDPSYDSPEWHDHVMTMFHKEELVNGEYPSGAGLRRVAEMLLGNIVSSRVVDVKYIPDSENGPGRACAIYEIVFDWIRFNGPTFVDLSIQSDVVNKKVFSDAADVWTGNTDDMFAAHPVATAVSRAESRVLRKALRLRGISAEELSPNAVAAMRDYKEGIKTGEWNPNDKISDMQKTFITRRCKDLGIDVDKFINKKYSLGVDKEPAYKSIDDIPKAVAVEMLNEINKYQTEAEGSKSIPSEILEEVK